MSTINDGGPAFPAQPIHHFPDGITMSQNQGGMTLRDYFAGQALAGISENIEPQIDKLDSKEENFDRDIKVLFRVAAYRAYTYADAMIAVRGVKK
jgi:hypothetical protein